MKADIKNRADIFLIVDEFYKRIRKDEEIGWIFNEMIKDWDAHLSKITDFWNMHLFKANAYFGNPIEAHNRVDVFADYKITPHDFGTWLYYWINVINEHFEGEYAEMLKFKARKMQTIFFIKMYENRPDR